MEWVTKIIEAAKLPTKFIVVIFLVSVGFVFTPESMLSKMKLQSFSESYGHYASIIMLTSGALLLVESTTAIWKMIKDKIAKASFHKKIANRLKDMDPAEKAVLREFYLQGQNTIKLPMDHPVVAGLLNSSIIVLVGQHGRASLTGMLFSMKIAESAMVHITNELIDFPSGEPTDEDLIFLRDSRPSFISSIQREGSLFNF